MADPLPPQDLPKNPYGGNGPLLMGVTWSLTILAMILMGLRTYGNAKILQKFSWDYLWAMITLLTSLVGQSLQSVATHSGLCNHIYLLRPANAVTALKWAWIGQILILNAIGFGKVAICAFLLRVQDRSEAKGKWFLYFVAISGLLININQTVMMLTGCAPVARHWDRSLPGTCDHLTRLSRVGYFQGSWAAASDFALAIYPLIVFRNLKISLQVRLAMIVLFGGGVLAGAASAIKTVHIKLLGLTTDITYGVYDLVIWGLVECWLVLILGCLPSLRSLFMRATSQVAAIRSHSHSRSHPNRNNLGYQRSKTDHVIAMYPGAKHSGGDQSHESEECIIAATDEGIMKTTDIHISRGGATHGNGDKDPMTVTASPV